MASARLYGVIHGFRTWRIWGTDILELNMAQELSIVYQDPMFLVLLDF